MRAKLKLLRGSQAGKSIELKKETFLIGRADGCHLRPNHDAISRRHCQFTMYPNKVTVQDLGSRNGTYVNGERTSGEVVLKTGDEVRLGPLKFEVFVTDDVGKIITIPVPKQSSSVLDENADDSGLISQWLEEAEEAAHTDKPSSSVTRQFQLDSPDAKSEDETAVNAVDNDTKSFLGLGRKDNKKKQPGKLPTVKNDAETANSREAAAETLKKLFNRGTS